MKIINKYFPTLNHSCSSMEYFLSFSFTFNWYRDLSFMESSCHFLLAAAKRSFAFGIFSFRIFI